jgi:hypothetical protein
VFNRFARARRVAEFGRKGLGMKTKKDMTPGVVGTALAAVAAGSLVLFSLVLQQSAFDTSRINGLEALSPSDSRVGINVAAAPDENDSAGGTTPGAETPTSEDTSAPTTGTDSFSPILDDGDLVASADDSSGDGDFPGASGGTGSTVDNRGFGATVEAGGPQATISKDPNGRPGDVTLPDRNGPKNTSPPHGPRPDSDDDDSDGRADRDRDNKDKSSEDGAKNDRKDSREKDKSNKDKSSKGKDKSNKDKSSRDKAKTDKPRNPGKSNGSGRDNGRDGRSGDRESEDRNDRHDSRRDSDQDDDKDEDDNDRDDDSHHSDDDSRGHSRTRGSKH